ncbi:hypothetical protein XH79_06975 [Bradyrhizobium sp. CCBAU 45389]|nr:hypothetical protein [Bradyrhizobium sp. CCBAU 45389]
MIGRTGERHNLHPLVTAHFVDHLALPAKLHSFRRITSCSISLSSDRSAQLLQLGVLVLELLQPSHFSRQQAVVLSGMVYRRKITCCLLEKYF